MTGGGSGNKKKALGKLPDGSYAPGILTTEDA